MYEPFNMRNMLFADYTTDDDRELLKRRGLGEDALTDNTFLRDERFVGVISQPIVILCRDGNMLPGVRIVKTVDSFKWMYNGFEIDERAIERWMYSHEFLGWVIGV